ncbi:hypothetical protein, partial [Microbacterium rhizomatis]
MVRSRTPGSGNNDSPRDQGTAPAPAQTTPGVAPDDPCHRINRCNMDYEVGLIREITLADLVSFTPTPPTLTNEPAGYGITKRPT